MGELISVIVPARDSADVISDCLAGLAEQTRPPDEIIVVDDASGDDTARVAARAHPRARVIALHARQGFAGASLAGLEHARGEWIAALNADARPDPDWLAEAVARAGDDLGVGMVACRVVLAGPEGTVDSRGIALDRTGMARLADHGVKESALAGCPAPDEVFGPAGSAALYRRSALMEAGWFERDYFLFYEDVDLAFRLRRRGYVCRLADKARVVHCHSHVTGRAPREKRYYLQRNRLRTIVRNWPRARLALSLPAIIAFDLASLGLAITEGSLVPALRARADFIRALPGDLAFRRRDRAKARVSDAEIAKWIGT